MSVISIGAFDAKTKFSELLRNVEKGVSYSITRNGKSVAVLQSTENVKKTDAMKAFERICNRHEKIKNGFSMDEILEMKNDGRKY